MRSFLILLSLLPILLSQPANKTYCTRTNTTCWPTQPEIDALYQTLEPSLDRILTWTQGSPRVGPVITSSPNDQPFWGKSKGLKPLYAGSEGDSSYKCFDQTNETSDYCFWAHRNLPYFVWNPSFVVFPLKAVHVQAAVNFASKHNLCVMVAGTGNDLLNRHSCKDGFFIRLNLMKGAEWDLTDAKGFGHTPGNVKFGPGMVFSEAQKSAADNKRVIASGWSHVVGVVGWSIGGGHGPLVPALGLGVDNILEVEIVLANGTLVLINSKQNKDLFWAIRGGGGSTWGVITSITLKAYLIPTGGFTHFYAKINGNTCEKGLSRYSEAIYAYTNFSISIGSKWGGYTNFNPKSSDDPKNCGGIWEVEYNFFYQGPSTDKEFLDTVNSLKDNFPEIQPFLYKTYSDYYEAMLDVPMDYLIPQNVFSDKMIKGDPSVLIGKETIQKGKVYDLIIEAGIICLSTKGCLSLSLCLDITGNVGSPQLAGLPISDGMRTSLLHLKVDMMSMVEDRTYLNKVHLLGNNSYFSESAYEIEEDAWKARYWGNNYEKLEAIKTQIDPNNVFYCYHCVAASPAAIIFDNTNNSNTTNASTSNATISNKSNSGSSASAILSMISAFSICLFLIYSCA